MENFTPVSATIGGILIGLAATVLMTFNGRIAGISGILSGAAFSKGDRSWRILFLIGLVLGPVIYAFASGATIPFEITPSWTLIVTGGLLVGFGTRLGSGCTSGHGVCGLARFSPRSLAAVCLFILAGVVTVALVKIILAG